jgi:nitroreductase
LKSKLVLEDVTTTALPARTALHPLLADRRSPRAFAAAHELDDTALTALLEAARWAPSANNSQPWRFGVARRGEPAFDALFEALMPGNQLWAGNASALVLVAATDVDSTGRPMRWARYDTGQAVAHLTVQAQAQGLVVHQLGGFEPAAAARAFALPDGATPVVVVAVGVHDPDVALPEPLAERERAPRVRRALEELMLTPQAPLRLSA